MMWVWVGEGVGVEVWHRVVHGRKYGDAALKLKHQTAQKPSLTKHNIHLPTPAGTRCAR